MKKLVKTLHLVDTPEAINEYKKIHDAIWPEIVEGIRKVGISSMDIYLRGNLAVMVAEYDNDINIDEAMNRLASLPRQQEWEEYVSKFQICHPNDSSSEKWQSMERVFSLPD